MTSRGGSKAAKPAPGQANPTIDESAWRKAETLAVKYHLVLMQEAEGYVARVSEFPGVIVRGGDPNACERNARQAISIAVATMLMSGDPPPLPAGERRSQVNVRLTAEERVLLETTARQEGFRGLSDYIRSRVLGLIRSKTR